MQQYRHASKAVRPCWRLWRVNFVLRHSSPIAGQRSRHRKCRKQRGAVCEDRGGRSRTAVNERGHQKWKRQPRQLLIALQIAAHQLQHGEQRLQFRSSAGSLL